MTRKNLQLFTINMLVVIYYHDDNGDTVTES